MSDDCGWEFDRGETNGDIEQGCSLTTAAFTGVQNMVDVYVLYLGVSCKRRT